MPKGVAYSHVDDQIFTSLQISDFRRSRGHSGHELETRRLGGRDSAYRQSSAFGRLRRLSKPGAFGLAKALGWMDISGPCDVWHWDRSRTTHDESGADGVPRRYCREPFRRRVTPHIFSLLLDTTPTLRRRHLCAA